MLAIADAPLQVSPGERLARFGPAHTGTLLAIAVFAVASVVLARCAPAAFTRRMRFTLAALMVGGALVEIPVSIWQGWATFQEVAPLQLCDLSLMLGAFTLLTLNRHSVEPLYFFALSGTLPALLTPELGADVLSFRFLIYFVLHGLTVIAALTLVLGLGVVPQRGAWWRALLWINVYAVVMALVNLALDTNFLYLRAKPIDPTPFDWFGPWPWYIGSLELVCFCLFLLLDQPLRALRRAPPRA